MRMDRIASLLLAVLLIFTLSSCTRYESFEYCEMGIYLTREFEDYDSEGAFHVAYSNGETIVGINRFSFVDCEEYGLLTTYTPEQLAKVYLYKLGSEAIDGVEAHGDVPYFCYTALSSDGNKYFYMPTFYRTPYAYFVITFVTPDIRAAEGRVEFLDYASTVHILDDYL